MPSKPSSASAPAREEKTGAAANRSAAEEKSDASAAKAVAKAAPKPDTSGIPRKVRARFRSGILYPLEDLDLEDGCEVEIYLRATPKKEKL